VTEERIYPGGNYFSPWLTRDRHAEMLSHRHRLTTRQGHFLFAGAPTYGDATTRNQARVRDGKLLAVDLDLPL